MKQCAGLSSMYCGKWWKCNFCFSDCWYAKTLLLEFYLDYMHAKYIRESRGLFTWDTGCLGLKSKFYTFPGKFIFYFVHWFKFLCHVIYIPHLIFRICSSICGDIPQYNVNIFKKKHAEFDWKWIHSFPLWVTILTTDDILWHQLLSKCSSN